MKRICGKNRGCPYGFISTSSLIKESIDESE
jgi:hypothetical protein